MGIQRRAEPGQENRKEQLHNNRGTDGKRLLLRETHQVRVVSQEDPVPHRHRGSHNPLLKIALEENLQLLVQLRDQELAVLPAGINLSVRNGRGGVVALRSPGQLAFPQGFPGLRIETVHPSPVAEDVGSALVITAGLNDTTTYSDDLHLAPAAGSNQVDINEQFTKLSWEVRSGASAAVATRRAFKLAGTAPGGPVYVAFSRAAMAEKVTGEIWPAETFMIDARPRPATDKLERLARWLIEAERPAVIFGDEISRTNAQGHAVELCELLGLVAATGQQGFGNFPTFHPQYVGGLRASRPFPFGGHDVVVQFGARDPGGGTVPRQIRSPERYAAVGLDTSMLGRTQPLDLAIVADVSVALEELTDAVQSLATKERLATIREARLSAITPAVAEARAQREAASRENLSASPIHPDRLDYELNKGIDPHAIVAMENLTGPTNFMRFGFREDEKMRLRSNGTALGWGVGAAIGAQLADPDRQVVLSIGDGSVMFSASGFWTMARYDIPVLTVVWNNRNYQTVRRGFHAYGGRMAETGQYHGMHLGDPDIDFVGLAASQGVKGQRVTSAGDLEGAIRTGVEETRAGRPYLLEVVISTSGGGAESTWHRKFSLAAQRSTA